MSEEKTYNLEDLEEMPKEEFEALISMPNIIIQGTAVVRDKDGNIKGENDGSCT